MKVESVSVRNFKVLGSLDVSFRDQSLDEISDRFLILGDNGSGKTSLLQAIALPLALAFRSSPSIDKFAWHGFLAARYLKAGPPRIELVVRFSPEEIERTRDVARRWWETQPAPSRKPFTEPGKSPTVRLVMEGNRWPEAGSLAELFQFSGRYYTTQLLKTDPSARAHFKELPGFFHFDQYRNLGMASPSPHADLKDAEDGLQTRQTREHGIASLRQHLVRWFFSRQTKSFRVDYLKELEDLFSLVFPGRSFANAVDEIPGTDDYFFLLNDGKREYELIEMSGGEQSVFPILYEFVRLHIAHSVVLIDEIDLNLHAPAAQMLVSQLTKIGPTCQFLFTTHSQAVSAIIPPGNVVRLPGGLLCL